MSHALSRLELIEIVLGATTDTIVDDANPARGVLRPNILVEGCRHVPAFNAIGYPDPERAARVFAGLVADAVLDRLSLRHEAAA